MKVILKKDIVNIGDENEIINVSEGFGRNFLLPKKLAIVASSSAIAERERNKKKIEKKANEKKEEMKKVAENIAGKTLEITTDAGESGKLFGSVTAHDIAVAIKKDLGIEIDKRKIALKEHIKAAGEYTFTIKLFKDVEVEMHLKVIASIAK